MFKDFWRDYAETQRVCTEFQRKHWKGQIVLSVAVGLATYGTLMGIAKIKERKEERKLAEYYKEV